MMMVHSRQPKVDQLLILKHAHLFSEHCVDPDDVQLLKPNGKMGENKYLGCLLLKGHSRFSSNAETLLNFF